MISEATPGYFLFSSIEVNELILCSLGNPTFLVKYFLHDKNFNKMNVDTIEKHNFLEQILKNTNLTMSVKLVSVVI
jgi:hypothetical protein